MSESAPQASGIREAIYQILVICLNLFQYAIFGAKKLISLSGGRDSAEKLRKDLASKLEGTEDQNLSKIASTLSKSKGSVIFYGTQSGTAKNFAHALSYKFSRVLVETAVCDPSDYNMGCFVRLVREYGDNIIFGFIIATYGEGGPTDNISEFFGWLADLHHLISESVDSTGLELEQEDKLPLEKLRYYIFGLGNSTYQGYNEASKTLDRQLKLLGGKRLGDLALADECNDQSRTFDSWQKDIVKATLKESGMQINSEEYKSKFRLHPHKCPVYVITQKSPEWRTAASALKGCIGLKRSWKRVDGSGEGSGYEEVFARQKFTPIYTQAKPFYAKVKASRLMFSNTYDKFTVGDNTLQWAFPSLDTIPAKAKYGDGVFEVERQCIHVDIDISKSGISYETGDYVYISPRNNPCDVERLIKALKWEDTKNQPIEMIKKDDEHFLSKKPPIVGAFTPIAALENYYEITAPLTQERLDIIARYTVEKTVADRLFILSEDFESYNSTILKPRRSLADVLIDSGGTFNLPQEVVFGELLDRIIPRAYSIASSSIEEPNTISIVAVVVRYALASPQLCESPGYASAREGLTTSWLHRSHEYGTFALMEGPDTISDGEFPVSYIPLYKKTSTFKPPKKLSIPIIMIGPGTGVAPFRAFIRERCNLAKKGKSVGKTILFYGCRTKDSHLYREEFEGILADKPGGMCLKIFNAYSREIGKSRIYVQDLMMEQKTEVWSILNEQRGFLYICGDSKSMGTDVRRAVEEIYSEFCPNTGSGGSFITKLLSEGRLFEDLW